MCFLELTLVQHLQQFLSLSLGPNLLWQHLRQSE
jgi:hypothetical protein